VVSDETPASPDANAGSPPPSGAAPKKRTLASSTALPLDWQLNEFVIEGLVGEGGFGVVYFARDTQLERTVAIKEYMPAQLAQRMPDQSVQVRSQRQAETFALGLRSFVNEARLLAMFDHPSLVKVYRFWEANGTAYMVMPYYQGPTLKAWLIEHKHAPGEEWLKRLLRPMLDALELMHRDHCYHRDIAPDNILLLQGDRPLLLDFGAARRVIGDATQALTVILKPGYAPIEQYAEVASMKQGPWTDVYALCAVLYATITMTAPIPSVGRMIKDELPPAALVAAGRYSDAFLHAIDAGLAVRPEQRPQSIAELRRLLFPEQFVYSGPVPLDEVTGVLRELDPDSTISRLPGATSAMPLDEARLSRPAPLAPASVAASRTAPPAAEASAAEAAPIPTHPGRRASDKDFSAERGALASSPPSAFRRLGLPVGMALAVVALGLAWWMFGRSAAPAASDPPNDTTPPISAAPSPAPSPAPEPAASNLPSPQTPAVPTRAPFEIVKALEDMVLQADPLFAVNTLPDESPVVIGRDRLQFRVKSSRPGYLYVFLAGTDASHFYMLFPNKIDANNRIQADRMTVLPRAGWHITAGGPPGVNHIVTVVSTHPLDLSDTGLRPEGDLSEFDLTVARQRWDAHQGPGSPFLGKPKCNTAACDAAYGAAMVKIEEVAR
jgi:serine/threonine protein kinase